MITNNILRVYVASRYERKSDAKTFANRLKEFRFECTSSWLDIDDEKECLSKQDIATRDIEDINFADVVVILSDPEGALCRGGKHVECGVAIGLNKPRVIIGRGENVFHWAKGSHIVPTEEAAIEWLLNYNLELVGFYQASKVF